MASLRIMFVTLAIMGIAISNTLATDYIVGDDNGWTLNFDYQTWANSKQFWIGDRIIFKYPVGAHNVVKVDKDSFQACLVPAEAETLGTGNDVIELKTAGTKSYICGVGKHCEIGKMKLSINVWAQSGSSASAPAPLSKGPYY